MSWQYVVRPGSSAKLHWPHGLAFGTSNDLYVASSSETRIQRYALSNGSLLGEYVDGSLNRPISVLASSGTTLFVTVLVGRFIARLDRASGAWGTRIMDPLLGRPGAALLSQQGDMVVANDEANTVLRVNVQTGVVRSFITMPTGHVPGGLLEVSGNRLLVSDSAEGRVLSFDATTGAFQRQLFRVHPDFRDHPVAMDNGIPGEVLVCDYAANAVVRFDAATGARRGDLVPTAHASGLRGPSWVLVRARP